MSGGSRQRQRAGDGADAALTGFAPAAVYSPAPHVERFNKAAEMPLVNIARMFVRAHFPRLSITQFLDLIADAPGFPDFSVRSLLDALEALGVAAGAAAFDVEDLDSIPLPFLCRLKGARPEDGGFVLVQRLEGGRVDIVEEDEPRGISRAELAARWTGIVLYAEALEAGDQRNAEVEEFRSRLQILPRVVTPADCERLIDLAERRGFRRSRVSGGSDKPGAISVRVRSSTSTVLGHDDPVLRRLYESCAEFERADLKDLEWIQCVRYKPGQKFRPHFDAGNGMPRRSTWLVYLNDGFEGGGTAFPEIGLVVQPKAGTVVRFDDCDEQGRVLWPSKHSGLPVLAGTKYALNLWIRMSGLRNSPEPDRN